MATWYDWRSYFLKGGINLFVPRDFQSTSLFQLHLIIWKLIHLFANTLIPVYDSFYVQSSDLASTKFLKSYAMSKYIINTNISIPNYYIHYKSLIERSMIRLRIRRIAIYFAFAFGILKIFHLFRMLNGVYLLAMIILFTLSRKCIYFISSKERVPLRKLIWLSSNSNKRMRKDASKPK